MGSDSTTLAAPNAKPAGAFARVVGWLAAISDQLSAFICAFLIVSTTIAMVLYQLGVASAWLDDLLRMLLIWLVYLGTVSLCLNNDHITMDAVYARLPPRLRRTIDILVALLGVTLCALVSKIGYDSLMQTLEYNEQLPSGFIPAWPQSLAIPLCFGLMTLAYLSHLATVLTGGRRRSRNDSAESPPAPNDI